MRNTRSVGVYATAALSFSDYIEGILVVFQSSELDMPQVVIDVPVLADRVK
jgi:hypothetical protein